MKVLQINSVCGVGSTGRIATDLHSILKEQGHESYIAYGRGETKNCDNAIKIGNKLDNYMHVAQTRLLDKHGLGSYRATKEFIKQIDKIDPDIIHLHNIHGYYINIKILFDYLKKINKPIVWTLHDCWIFTGHCSHFDYIGCNKWKSGCEQCPQKKEYPKTMVRDNSKQNYLIKQELFTGIKNMTIVTPSKWLANLVKESFLKEYPIKVINNGIDLNTFTAVKSKFRDKLKLNNKFIILGVASMWGEKKGLNYFVELSKNLKKDECIILIGLTEKQKARLPKNIIGINRTNNVEQLAEIYTNANVFLNPTLEDNFPTTNLEALACGTPLIVFDTGGNRESICEETGFLIEKGNNKAIRKYIDLIKKIGKKAYSDNCRLRAINNYNKEDKFKEYIELYKTFSSIDKR